MYNREIKEQFLAEYDGNRVIGARPNLELISVYEELFQKDLAEMSFNEAVEAISGLNIGTYKTAAGVQSFIRSYVKWCEQFNKFKNINLELCSINADDIDCSKRLCELVFKSEDELIKELGSVRPFDEGYPESIAVLLTWIGVKQSEISSIKISDVNLEKRWVYIRDRDLFASFSEKIADIFRVYEKTKVGYRSAGGDSRPVFRDDSHDGYVKKYFPKGKSGDPFTSVQIKHIVHHLNSIYVDNGNPPKFTGSNILMSGALYRVWELEQRGIDVFSIKNKKMVSNAFIAKANLYEILWLYKNYKRAFNL